MTKRTGLQLDGYCRVSQVRGREGESFLSPDLQRQAIEGWAKANGHTIAQWHTDLDQSGGKMNRPGFVAMMARVERGETQGVVVAKLDRFARSLPGALEAIKFLDEREATFVSVAEGVDPTTAAGKMMLRMLLVLAEFELDRIRDNWRSALTNAIEVRGIQPTVAPFGYVKDEHKRFVPHPEEAPYVREIFRQRLAGKTWASVARWLNDEGVKPRQASQWTDTTVKELTKREVYLGVVSKGDLRKEDAHEPLVSRADFLACRDVFAKAGDSPSDTRHALNGIIRCAGCSRMMSGRGYKQKGQPRVPQYQCNVNHGAGNCPAPANVNEGIIMPFVEHAFFEYVAELGAESRPMSVDLDRAYSDYRSAEAALVAYRDEVDLPGIIGMESFKLGLRARQEVVQGATEALERAKREATGTELPAVEELRAAWPSLNTEERQRLLASAIDVIYVRRVGSGRHDVAKRVRIVWRGENSHPLSGPGRSVPIRSEAW
jgi:site-specific DNA recombinase